ncbi:MAG: hypothetical protein Q4D79_15430 [Propionibacteriaceae bacterium]|nr:hypothetical protein [Propionibacteriaceae bacterium]
MMTFLARMVSITAKRRPKRPIKEAVTGLVCGLVLGGVPYLSREWGLALTWGYLLCQVAVSMSKNEIFFSDRDMRRLGFKRYGLGYCLAYAAHYVARDLYVANLLALMISTAMTALLRPGWLCLMPLTLFLGPLLVLPGHVRLAERLPSHRRTLYLIALAGLLGAMVFGLVVLDWRFPTVVQELLPMIHLGVCVLWAVSLVPFAGPRAPLRRGRVKVSSTWAWLPPHQWKDLRKEKGSALLYLAGSVGLFLVLIQGARPGDALGFALLVLAPNNLFLVKKEGSFRLISEDPLFDEKRLIRDLVFLRRSKLLTIALDIPIKTLIIWGLGWGFGRPTIEEVVLVPVLLTVANVVMAPVPFQAVSGIEGLRLVSVSGLVALYLVVRNSPGELLAVWLGCLLGLLLYARDYAKVALWFRVIDNEVRRDEVMRPRAIKQAQKGVSVDN